VIASPLAGCTSASVSDAGGPGRNTPQGPQPQGEAGAPDAGGASADQTQGQDGQLGGSSLGEQDKDPGAGGRSEDEKNRLEGMEVPGEGDVDSIVSGEGGGLFVSLAHLGQGKSAKDLEVFRYGVTKALNSVSTNPQIIKLAPVDPAESVYRLNPTDFRLSADDMNIILSAPGANGGVRQVGGAKVIKGDWLVYAVTRPEVYDKIMRIPNDVGALESQIGVNRSRGAISAEVGDGQSEVTFGRRTLERVPIEVGGEPGGYYWRSIDYFTALTAGEFFFSLPNGLQGYMLSGFATQHRIDAQPFVATDRNRPQDGIRQCVGGEAPCGYVINGESCITCHANGVKMSKNFGGVRGGSVADFEKLVAQDADRFAKALSKMGFDSVGVEPVLETLKVYRSVSGNGDKRQGGSEVNPVFPRGGIFQR
jgi:hypothetical protein